MRYNVGNMVDFFNIFGFAHKDSEGGVLGMSA